MKHTTNPWIILLLVCLAQFMVILDATVVNVPAESRYELRVGDRVIGCVAYRLQNGTIAFTHTVVDKACEGRGFGTRLVRDAVADAEGSGLRVVPLCSFARAYLERRDRG